MSVLARYISRMFFLRFAVVILSVAGFALVFDLLEAADSVIRGAERPALALARYAALRLPSLLSEMMPLGALVAGILTVGDLLRHRELVIVWNGGVSPLGIIVRLLPAGLMLIALKLAIDDQVTPRATAELRAWGVGEFRRSTMIGGAADAIWLRSGRDVVRIGKEPAARGEVADLTIFRRDGDGLLLERLDAARADPGSEGWQLREVVRRAVGAGRTERIDTVLWQGTIELAQIGLLAREPRELSLAQLRTVIENEGFAIRATEAYKTWYHVRLASAAVPFLLVILAFGVARRFSRTGTLTPIFLQGVGIGFSFLVAEGLMVALAEVGLVGPRLAAWLLPLGLAAAVLLPPVVAEFRVARFARVGRPKAPPPAPA